MEGLGGAPDSTLGVEKTCVDSDEVLDDLVIVTRGVVSSSATQMRCCFIRSSMIPRFASRWALKCSLI